MSFEHHWVCVHV